MIARGLQSTITALSLMLVVSGCGTPREKTAPCKRPTNLSSYSEAKGMPCSMMSEINVDSAATLAAIKQMAGAEQE
jgi:hypothetical protein